MYFLPQLNFLKSGKNIWRDILKIHGWQKSLWENAQVGNCKLKQDNTTHSLE